MPAKEKNAIESSDSALMLLYADGQVQGFEYLYKKHKVSIFKFFFYGTNGDRELSAELFQDVWMTIVRGRKRFTKDICFVDWLRHVAWARLYDHLRMYPVTLQREAEIPECLVSETELEPTNVLSLVNRKSRLSNQCSSDSGSDLLSKIQVLPDEQCEVVLLRYCFKMDLNEIASFLDVARTSVGQLHREALTSLRRTLPEAV